MQIRTKNFNMTTDNNVQPNPFRQTNAFAMNYALPFGIYWIAGLVCFVKSMDYTALSVACYFIFLSVPVVAYALLCRFRDSVCGGVISFGRGYVFALLVYFYAALILAAGAYVYFRFLDHGAFIQGYITQLDSPEVRKAFEDESLKQLTNGNGIDELKKTLQNMQAVSPVVYAANILDINIFLGLLLSIPTSLLAARRTPKLKQ